MIHLKICGMRDGKNIEGVASLRPHYMGFIFYNKSPRYVGENFNMPPIPENIKRVGVFVNESSDVILQHAKKYDLTYLQLHGEESAEQCEELKAHGLKIIKVFSIGDEFDFKKTLSYQNVVDYFLFDTKGKYYGGNSKTFDWKLLEEYNQKVPFFLSGGMNYHNINNIKNLQGMNLHAIDVNSGVELSPGLKDVKKISELKTILYSNF